MTEQCLLERPAQALEPVTDTLSRRSPLVSAENEKALSLLKIDQRRYQKPNTLVTSAQLLLSFASSCRGDVPPIPESQIKTKLVEAINHFMTQLRSSGYEPYEIMAARYLVSALLDDLISQSSWAIAKYWIEDGLLQEFDQEPIASGRFFQVLRRCCEGPDTYLDLLELGYYCLSLGFMADYRYQAGGTQQLAQMRDRLYRIVTLFRGEPKASFFWGEKPHIRKKRSLFSKFFRARAMGVIWLIVALFLLLLYVPYRYHLRQLAIPVHQSLQSQTTFNLQQGSPS